jgi:hypothetical protein
VGRRRRIAVVLVGASLGALGVTPPVAATEPPTMAFVGDSIGHRSEAEIRAEVTRTRRISHVFAADAATIGPSRRQIARAVTGPDPPAILVVELGTGDANLRHRAGRLAREIRAFLDATAPHVDCVRWLDVKAQGSAWPNVNANGALVNRLLRRIAGGYPNVEVVHYSTWAAHALPGHWLADALHLSASGRRELGRIVRQAADGCDPALRSGPFWDVRDDFASARSVAWLAAEGITPGFGNGSYRAVIGSRRLPATRGELASMLWRRAGTPASAVPSPWDDVGAALTPAVDWVAEQHLVAGQTGTSFGPDLDLTRGQLVTALWRLVGQPALAGAVPVDVPARLADAVRWALADGAIRLLPDGSFRPRDPVDRGRLAHALAPAAQRGPIAPPPPSGSHPAAPTTPLATAEDPGLTP